MKNFFLAECHAIRRLTAMLGIVLSAATALAQVNVTTWHNEVGRTGQNTQETILTPGNVAKNTFGKICSATVDGQVYAQPLTVWNSATGKNTVYVETENDTIYAFDGTNCSLIQKASLLPSNGTEYPVDCCFIGGGLCQTVAPSVGILSTPTIDRATNTLYVVTESQVGSTGTEGKDCKTKQPPSAWVHRLHALDLTSGQTFLNEKDGGPVQIQGSVSTGKTFSSKNQIQRPGLLWLNGDPSLVYLAFSMMDNSPPPFPPGWVFAYDAQNLADSNYPKVFATTPTTSGNTNGGGIWQGGAGLAAGVDSKGGKTYIYFGTGNGTFDAYKSTPPNTDYGQSFVKLNVDLSGVADYFAEYKALSDGCECVDLDFGAGGVALIPDNTLSDHPYIAVAAGKQKEIFVLDRAKPGKYHGSCTGKCPAFNSKGDCAGPPPVCKGTNENIETVPTGTNYRVTPAFWNSSLYYSSAQDALKLYPVSATCENGQPGPVCPWVAESNDGKGDVISFLYGVTPSVSADGTASGIVWAIRNYRVVQGGPPATLFAFAGNTLGELYDSTQCVIGGKQVDEPGPATKFSVPTIANGYVYIGTQTDFDIYGPLTRTCN